MSQPLPVSAMNYVGPAIAALVFVLGMSLVKEPTRRTFNAVFVVSAGGTYLSGGFGLWELVYPVMAMPVVYLALRSYRLIGVAWLMHACWDLAHHFWGGSLWPFPRCRCSDAWSSTRGSRCGFWRCAFDSSLSVSREPTNIE